MCVLSHFSCVQVFATPWTVVCYAPLFMGFSRQEYRSGLPCLPPGDRPNPGIKPPSLKSPAVAGEFFTTSATWYKVHTDYTVILGFKVRTGEHLAQPPWPAVSWAKCHHDTESEDYWEMPKLEWVKVKSLSRVWLFVTPCTVALQAPLSMGFSRQEYWSGLPFPSPGDLPDPGIKPRSPALQADALTSAPPGRPQS